MNSEINSKIRLALTKDIDAWIKGQWRYTKVFRDVLQLKGLVLDELSTEIWIPDDAVFIEYYDSPSVKVSYLDPISALTSKAKSKLRKKIKIWCIMR